MQEVKTFIKEHKKELAIGAGIIFIYTLGYKRGYKSYKNVVNNVITTMKTNGYNVVQLIPPVAEVVK